MIQSEKKERWGESIPKLDTIKKTDNKKKKKQWNV